MHVQHKASFVQREVSGRSAKICDKRSQKPSQVCGTKRSDNKVALATRGELRGLITLSINHENKCNKRCQKIRRLVKQFRQKRQQNLDIGPSREAQSSRQQQNDAEEKHSAKPSIERLFSIDSTSESSSNEFEASTSNGVHTDGDNFEKNVYGRNAGNGADRHAHPNISGRKSKGSLQSPTTNSGTGSSMYKDVRAGKYSDTRIPREFGTEKRRGNAGEHDASWQAERNSGTGSPMYMDARAGNEYSKWRKKQNASYKQDRKGGDAFGTSGNADTKDLRTKSKDFQVQIEDPRIQLTKKEIFQEGQMLQRLNGIHMSDRLLTPEQFKMLEKLRRRQWARRNKITPEHHQYREYTSRFAK